MPRWLHHSGQSDLRSARFFGPEGTAHVAHGKTMGGGCNHRRCVRDVASRRLATTGFWGWLPQSHGFTMG